MITEDYVSFETAKLLKEKGFDKKCHRYWQYDKANNKDDVDGICLCCCDGVDGVFELSNSELNTLFEESLLNFGYSAPTLQVAMKWLREVHNIHVVPKFDFYAGDYTGRIYDGRRKSAAEKDDYIAIVGNNTYEEAGDAAIKYCLEKLI